MAQTTSNRQISAGNGNLSSVSAIGIEYATLMVKFSDIDSEVKLKIQQSLDDENWSEIAFPGSKEMALIIRGSGCKTINLVGLHCTNIRVVIDVKKATAGTLDKIILYND